MKVFLLLPLFALIVACAPATSRDGGDILALGDSVMWWNEENSVADSMGRALDREVLNLSVPGAQFSNGNGLMGAFGFDIQRQFDGGRWNWIVLNGGANDLGADDCGCGACASVVDDLIGPDSASGEIPAFLSRLTAETGAQILWMGYYAGNGKGSFEGCRDDLVEMERRIARFAASRPGVFFVDAEDVIDPKNPAHFDEDNTHPSAQGSALIGAHLARTIAGRSQTAD